MKIPKTRILTNHAIERYSIRTGRPAFTCSIDLLHALLKGTYITKKEAEAMGFSITRRFKGDLYIVWYDKNIKENLLAIQASDGAIKTVMTKDFYGFRPTNRKVRQREAGGRFEC